MTSFSLKYRPHISIQHIDCHKFYVLYVHPFKTQCMIEFYILNHDTLIINCTRFIQDIVRVITPNPYTQKFNSSTGSYAGPIRSVHQNHVTLYVAHVVFTMSVISGPHVTLHVL